MTLPSTRTDFVWEWAINDRVTQLRNWATHTVHPLPAPPIDECWVGTDATCAIRLDDPRQKMSRQHARLVRDLTTWRLRDNDSKNGIKLDGAKRVEIELEPGIEIGIGGVTLIAESVLSIALRNFLARLLGTGLDRAEVVDHAFRSIRLATTLRTALVVCGDGDLVPLAYSIHRHSRGADRPFIVCDRRRQPGGETVRSAENYTSGLEALTHAAGGSLCLRTRRLPYDFNALLEALRSPTSQVQLIMCADEQYDCAMFSGTPIVIPPLTSREAELDSIIDEYAAEAMTQLGSLRYVFPEVDCAWVRQHSCASLSEIEKGTLRLVALRTSRNFSHAAASLGMAPVSLSRWIGRRALPMELDK